MGLSLDLGLGWLDLPHVVPTLLQVADPDVLTALAEGIRKLYTDSRTWLPAVLCSLAAKRQLERLESYLKQSTPQGLRSDPAAPAAEAEAEAEPDPQ